ncbi:MAG: radical SAM protein [Actinobacteria bacterium]|nr:radical SAM protein [Actinomycetota bacterium]
MRYEEPVFRPPCEAASLIIQATVGCPHNRCTFCSMYKEKKYRVRPVLEIKEDIDMARSVWADPTSVFLADGNTIAMRTGGFIEVLDYLNEAFPRLERISCYGGARFIRGRDVADLTRLAEHGLKIIYMGLESGDDEILRRVRKGVTADDYVKAAEKVKQAGIELSVYVLAGLGGRGRTREHAINSALTLNRMKPDYIRIRTLVILPGVPMYEEVLSGEFEECSGREIAQETRLLLSHLDVEGARFLSDHVSNYLPLYGRLPEDREELIAAIDQVLAHPDPPMLKPRIIHSL